MSGTANGRPGHRRLLGSLATGATFVALAMTAGAAWNGEQSIVLGDSVSSTFQSDPGAEMHRYGFYAPTGTSLKAKIKVDKGASLAPAWQVFTLAGDEVDLGDALKGTQIKNYTFEEGGFFYMQVTSTSGEGRYDISTKGKFPGKINEKNVADGMTFEAAGGMILTAKLKGGPSFSEMIGPFGPIVIDADTVSLKKFVLPDSGTYHLVWDGVASKVSIQLQTPSKRKFFFGAVEPERGTADLAQTEWLGSGHADALGEPFRHWDEDGEIQESCAACHSSYGFQDFVGADGTPSNVLGAPHNRTDNPAALGSTVDCDACHNSATPGLDTVQFPSGNIVDGLGPEARCMQCHQGRESGNDLDTMIDGAMLPDDDTESSALRFLNVHYYAAGASLMGATAGGGYEYEGNFYDHRFPHVSTIDDCQECHNQHTLELRYETCAECHSEGSSPSLHETPDWVYDIRQVASLQDYDGDGNTTEGIYYELDTMGANLLSAIQAYGASKGTPITYNASSYPYWFNDTEAGGGFNHWTARLLRAAYNYQYWAKDPGLFAHNAKYGIQFMYDSLATLHDYNNALVPGFENMRRSDTGHFNGSAEAFRHWDEEGEVSSSCAQCHSAEGFAFAARYGIPPIEKAPVTDGFTCEQCHPADSFTEAVPARYFVAKVTFPSGVSIENDDQNPDDSFLCMTCHQGRQSKTQVDEKIASGSGPYSFSNIHYLAAGPTLYGADAAVGYEYDDNSFIGARSYEGKWEHASPADDAQCAFCHLSDHSFLPQSNSGCGCHGDPSDITDIRLGRGWDYNGNGNDTNEKLLNEVKTYADRLLLAMADYAEKTGMPTLVYDGSSYPYFINGDTGGSYRFDAPMLKASFNYQFWAKDYGSWAHNTFYTLELLYDSIDDMQLAAADAAVTLDYNYLTTNPDTGAEEILSIRKDGNIGFERQPLLVK